MAEEMDDDAGFPQEDIEACVKDTIMEVLESANWDDTKVEGWINEICEKIMKRLVDLKMPYKFIVTCMLVQKTEKPLFSSFSTHWENNTDGLYYEIYPPLRQKESAGKTI